MSYLGFSRVSSQVVSFVLILRSFLIVSYTLEDACGVFFNVMAASAFMTFGLYTKMCFLPTASKPSRVVFPWDRERLYLYHSMVLFIPQHQSSIVCSSVFHQNHSNMFYLKLFSAQSSNSGQKDQVCVMCMRNVGQGSKWI